MQLLRHCGFALYEVLEKINTFLYTIVIVVVTDSGVDVMYV